MYIYGSYRKNKIGVPLFWTTLYMYVTLYSVSDCMPIEFRLCVDKDVDSSIGLVVPRKGSS